MFKQAGDDLFGKLNSLLAHECKECMRLPQARLVGKPKVICGNRVTSPPLKWAGGKRRLLKHILPLVPNFTGVYREPFVGGGAVFFALQPEMAVLSDSNTILMRAYRGIRDDVEKVIRMLNIFSDAQRYYGAEKNYYTLRKFYSRISTNSDQYAAAWLIYMNRTGFNGLYRVNKKGEFNTPWGKREFAFDAEKLREASRALNQRVGLKIQDFEEMIDNARTGDFVYCDPPYDGTYTGYTADGFTEEDQRRLSNCVLAAANRGVKVMVSNADTPLIRQLYFGMKFTELSAQRSIAADGGKRQRVRELIIQ